jgi:hypothetical protein
VQSKLAKKLRKCFERRLAEEMPQFTPIQGNDIPAGDRLYEWKMGERFSAFIFLAIAPSSDRFTLEAAWSLNGRFPAYHLCMLPVDIPERGIVKDKPKDNAFRFRLGMLWSPHKDFWWAVSDQPANQAAAALALLQDPNYPFDLLSTKSTEDFTAECVEDAIARIRQYAVPYFEDAAREAG